MTNQIQNPKSATPASPVNRCEVDGQRVVSGREYGPLALIIERIRKEQSRRGPENPGASDARG
jgi:hypothetical protein